ncbi:MAG: putative lipid II flippase FtsW [bacterium]
MLFIVAALLSIGLLMVFSASPTMAMKLGDSYYYLKRHIFALLVGSLALYAGFKTDHDRLKVWSPYIIAFSLFLLAIVLIPGISIERGGASRWLPLGFFSFQPAEITKLALILFLAKELSSKPLSSAILPALGAVLAAVVLIILEPDMGTAIIIAMIAFALFYLAGTPVKHFIAVLLASLFGLFLISIASPYRLKRLLAYIDPWKDPRGVGFHIIQSLIAVGSGGLFGLGLGGSKQKFFYLPQNYTDFIFAIFCEEMGLIGSMGIIILFFLFIGRGMRTVINAPDNFSFLLAGGIVSWIGLQAMLNMSVVLGILPTTGIPLPFISYGGTSLVITLFSVGILLNISRSRLSLSASTDEHSEGERA